MRKKLFAGNWKMNKGIEQSRDFVNSFVQKFQGKNAPQDAEYVIFSQSACLPVISDTWKAQEATENLSFAWGPQSVHWEENGAFTGEFSLQLANELGCKFALAGHSERRQFFGETNESAAQRALATCKAGLHSIFCLGEQLEARESGKTFAVIEEQFSALSGISLEGPRGLVLAYEPVWAIGTGKTASSEQAQEVHAHLRKLILEAWGEDFASQTQILYGGSVKANNSAELMACADVDGVLVGGASLDPEGFLDIAVNAK